MSIIQILAFAFTGFTLCQWILYLVEEVVKGKPHEYRNSYPAPVLLATIYWAIENWYF
jgi:hypothetical protein